VLDHVERGRVLEQPARKDLPPPGLLLCCRTLVDEHLDEGANFLGLLPGQGPLAARELDDDIADLPALAGLHDEVLCQVVALVEQAERRHAVLVRRADAFSGREGIRGASRLTAQPGIAFLRRLFTAAAASGEQQDKAKGCGRSHPPRGQASGDQAS